MGVLCWKLGKRLNDDKESRRLVRKTAGGSKGGREAGRCKQTGIRAGRHKWREADKEPTQLTDLVHQTQYISSCNIQ